MVKVLVLSGRYKGDYRLFNDMVFGLDPSFFEAKVCYISGSPDGKNTLDRYGKAIYLDTGGATALSGIKRLFGLLRILRAEKPAIIHCHRHRATVYGVIAAQLSGLKTVVLSHVHGLNRTRTLKRRLVNRLILKMVKGVIAVSEGVRADVLKNNRGLDPAKVITVWNGINIDAVSPAPENLAPEKRRGREGLVFGTVGRLAPTKGHSYLIEAFAQVVKALPSSRLVMVGGGPLEGELKKKAMELGISSEVEFLGYRNDVPELLSGFDVFVFPSIAEGLPAAVLEAMAAGLPVIASEVGGIPEIFGKGGFGSLVPAKDPDALASAMIEAGLVSPEKRFDMGWAGRLRVEEAFTSEAMCRGLMGVYRKAIGQGGGHG